MLFLEGCYIAGSSLEEIKHTLVGGAKVFGNVANNGCGNVIPVLLSHVVEGVDGQHLLILVLFEG